MTATDSVAGLVIAQQAALRRRDVLVDSLAEQRTLFGTERKRGSGPS
jgi:hypothetical protein